MRGRTGGSCEFWGWLNHTHIGGYGFVESRCARAFFVVVGFWCFGGQVEAREKRRVVRGRTGGSCEFGGWLIYSHIGGYGFESRCARAFLLLLAFGALGGASRSARKKASRTRPHWRKLRVWGLAEPHAHWRLRVRRVPLCTCVFCCCWLLVLWGASRSARKKASRARPHWRKLRVWGLANIFAHWRLRVRIPLCTCVFVVVGFWCFRGRKS